MKARTISFVALVYLCATFAFASQKPYLPNTATVIPTGIDGKAYDIIVVSDQKPLLQPIQTTLPVLFYAGTSADSRYEAYTSLAAYDELAPNGRREVTSARLSIEAKEHLVPTGELVIEDKTTGARWNANSPNQYAVSAAWSPRNPNLIAFTFSSGSDYGLAVANVRSKTVKVVQSNNVLPDKIAWDSSGENVQFYEKDNAPSMLEVRGESSSHFALAQAAVAATSDAKSSATWSTQLPQPDAFKGRMEGNSNQAFFILLPDGIRFTGTDLVGSSEGELRNSKGELLRRVTTDVIAGVASEGIAFKNFLPTGVELNFMTSKGQVYNLSTTSSIVQYFLPFFSFTSPTITVTQVGNGYTTACGVVDHKGNLAYAYDMQARPGSESVESAASGTIAYLASFVTCNSMDNGSDGTTCSDYRSTCNSNGNWGNVIIIQHADGTWTKYTHLKYGYVLPPSTGVSVDYGCEISREGHTGWTVGNKNGCGDHLHFQRQVSGDRDGSSTSITFADQVNPLRCTTYTSGNAGRSCLFR
jgi:hypothetical protein